MSVDARILAAKLVLHEADASGWWGQRAQAFKDAVSKGLGSKGVPGQPGQAFQDFWGKYPGTAAGAMGILGGGLLGATHRDPWAMLRWAGILGTAGAGGMWAAKNVGPWFQKEIVEKAVMRWRKEADELKAQTISDVQKSINPFQVATSFGLARPIWNFGRGLVTGSGK